MIYLKYTFSITNFQLFAELNQVWILYDYENMHVVLPVFSNVIIYAET